MAKGGRVHAANAIGRSTEKATHKIKDTLGRGTEKAQAQGQEAARQAKKKKDELEEEARAASEDVTGKA
jgi:hypothetical protein